MMEASHFRTLNYVEVIYFDKGKYKGRKHVFYPEDEAKQMYTRTINKMSEDKKETLISLRDENHNIVKSLYIGK